ncbi:DNA endonuclease RBBP8 isoform X1 [Pundamilia nyererei]|uniref:DNA endonuclease RBBP8 n=1 Tax=Pundamilia nyererei TaxID=303518 RepID=A0A9Y6M673_9CICH|nr:PREDICTED: DNA endonuclease RBBP8 isoform X1 [Pundamilia nyererei]
MEASRDTLTDSFGNDSGTAKSADRFQDLWRQLGECHQNALQELEAKVSKLKKERCLDAQRLEVFYSRNQQLKEQNKNLQDAMALLEERLRAAECDRCSILEENMKNGQQQNLRLIEKLKNERNLLEDENNKLRAELQKLKSSRSESKEASPAEQEEGVIPDSPILPSSLPVVNRLKKQKNNDQMKRVRYAEVPLPQSNNSLFNDPEGATKNPGRAEVLVPNTCEMDASQISNDVTEDEEEAAIAETCGLELIEKQQMNLRKAPSQQRSFSTLWKQDVRLKPCFFSSSSTLMHSPDSTSKGSPSLLPRIKRFAEGGSVCRAKRVKEGSPEVQERSQRGLQEDADNQEEGEHLQREQISQTAISVSNPSIKKEKLDRKVQSGHNMSTSQKPSTSCSSPAFKKPKMKVKLDADGKKRTPVQDLNASQGQREAKYADRKHTVEPTWSVDPALALSMYDSEWKGDEEIDERQHHVEMADTDCTWVSHSLLQRQREKDRDRGDSVFGLGEKANDSLDMMFDTTAYGEYKSCNSSHLGQSQPCDRDDDEEEAIEDPPEDGACQSKARHPAFAHVAVVRKKDERRKLKGTTCKECEIYYTHLPEEEKQKKLSACSRHRFLYVPPCTPENFWEVGFPSTQTCIERGYIKEEKNPEARLRRRQPLNALFSPKRNKEEK